VGELVDGRGNLQPLHQNLALSLKTNVLGPTDKTGKVSGGLDVSSNTVVSGRLAEDGPALVVHSLLLLGNALSTRLCGCYSTRGGLSLGFATRLVALEK
jgi:hypothetical protein